MTADKEKLGDHNLVAAMPFGIVRLDVRKAQNLIIEIGRGNARSRASELTQSVICTLVNAAIIVQANDAACELTGFNREQLLSEPLATILTEDACRTVSNDLLDLFDGSSGTSSEGRLLRPGKEGLSVVLNLWLAEGGDFPDSVYLGITNISGRVTSEQMRDDLQSKLAHAGRIAMLGEMTASIAHEVNQPLGSIIASAEAGLRWLDRTEPDLAEVKALLERIAGSGRRAAEIVAAMRSMARNKKAERELVSVNMIIDEAIVILRSDLVKRQISLRLDLASELPEVSVDRTQILQVIVNLALNAAQAMSDGEAWNRTLLIRTRRDSETTIIVEVSDSGPGVDPSVGEKLFESFYTTKQTGIGMGLAISRAIVEAHESKIEFQSSPHLGAHFSFRLPLPSKSGLHDGIHG